DSRRRPPAQLAGHGARADQLPGPAGAHLLGRLGPAPQAGPGVQRDGAQWRAEGAGGDRSRPPGFRQRRLAEPRNRIDARWFRCGQRLALAQRDVERRRRRHLGVAAPRRRRGQGLFAAFRCRHRLRRKRSRRPPHRPRPLERPRYGRDAACGCGLRDRPAVCERAGAQAAHARPMTRIAILTPDPGETAYPELWPKVLARLQRALDGAGVEVVPTPWTAHVDDASGLREFACVLPLLAWGYHHDAARWQRACATWEREGLPLANPARVLAWNTDKRYLRELAERGVAIPPTIFADGLSRELVERAFADTGADELIVKPAVSGGAWKTRRLRRGDAVDAEEGMAMLLQPYLPTIETHGETSLLYFGGRLSHAVNKRPVSGEFRIQEEFGGQYARSEE